MGEGERTPSFKNQSGILLPDVQYYIFDIDGTLIKAELMEIPIADWPNIDRLEGYPRLYDRQLYLAKLTDGTNVDGWGYIMNKLPEGAKLIESGDWKVHRG